MYFSLVDGAQVSCIRGNDHEGPRRLIVTNKIKYMFISREVLRTRRVVQKKKNRQEDLRSLENRINFFGFCGVL